MSGRPGQSGEYVGFRSQPGAGEDYEDIGYSTTDNRLECPVCGEQWVMVKDSDCIDSGNLNPNTDGYSNGGTDDMIIFMCHSGHEFAKSKDNWSAQAE